jgi:hypothetical protein
MWPDGSEAQTTARTAARTTQTGGRCWALKVIGFALRARPTARSLAPKFLRKHRFTRWRQANDQANDQAAVLCSG